MTTRALPYAPHRARRAGLVALAAALLLTGCAMTSPVQTNQPARMGDGIDSDLSSTVLLRGLLIVAAEKNGPGRLSGQVVNDATSPVEVTFQAESGSSAKVEVGAGSATNLADEPLTLSKVPVAPGGLATITVSTAQTGEGLLQVPVLPPDRYLSTLTPGPEPSAAPSN